MAGTRPKTSAVASDTAEREAQDGPVESHRCAERQLVGGERKQEPDPRPGHQEPDGAAGEGEHEALREQLAHDPPATGAERGSDRHLAAARAVRARAAGSRR